MTTTNSVTIRHVLGFSPGSDRSGIGDFWQIQLNEILAGFPDVVNFSTARVHVGYLQLKVIKLSRLVIT